MSQRHIRYFQEFLNHEDYIIINKDNYISNTRELYYTLNSEGELSLSLFVVYPVKFIMRNTTNDTNIELVHHFTTLITLRAGDVSFITFSMRILLKSSHKHILSI